MRRRMWLLGALGATFLATAVPAGAIVHGTPDGDGHPYVGLLSATDGQGRFWRCTGTLVSPTVFVTAGHCTAGAVAAAVWLQSAPTPSDPHVLGTPYTDPLFDPRSFFLHDVGVVVLQTPVVLSEYGSLPAEHALDGLQPGARTTFTEVGYGMQRRFPDQGASSQKDVADPVRMVAHPRLITIDNPSLGPQSLVLSSNASTGGQCDGDSGAPSFLGGSNVIAGVGSYVKNQTCAGTGGVFRLDRAEARNFVLGFLP